MPTQVDVCVATFKRPLLLSKLLESLSLQELPTGIAMRIIVVDNDKNGSARPIVEQFSAGSDVLVVYDIEPVQNIARTRNRAVALAVGDYVAFIDDDETAEANWLDRILATADAFNADVVFGPVKPVLPDNTQDWIRKGHFFDRERIPTGTPRPHGGTGNTLVKTEVLHRSNMILDPAFGLTGGADTELFTRLQKQGAKLVWCDEAICYEQVPQNRMTVGWLVRRSFRGGQTASRIFFREMTVTEKLIWASKRMVGLG
jgi:succinoglycan biosynthesis protein ExoM